jgi:hypothetical protein
MRNARRAGLGLAAVALLAMSATAEKKEFTTPLTTGAFVSIINEYGSISVQPASGSKELSITAVPHSSKVEVDFEKTGVSRVVARSHVLQAASPEEAAVDYEVRLPAGANISLRSTNGPLTVDGISAEITCEGESTAVQIRNSAKSRVRVHTVEGPVTLTNLKNTNVDIVSIAGNVALNAVSGPAVTVSTESGTIQYTGDFSGGGNYSLSSHSGDIAVSMPANASVELSANSLRGSAEDNFRLDPVPHPGFSRLEGKSFAGTINGGASSVKLLSFSGKIRVSKQ